MKSELGIKNSIKVLKKYVQSLFLLLRNSKFNATVTANLICK